MARGSRDAPGAATTGHIAAPGRHRPAATAPNGRCQSASGRGAGPPPRAGAVATCGAPARRSAANVFSRIAARRRVRLYIIEIDRYVNCNIRGAKTAEQRQRDNIPFISPPTRALEAHTGDGPLRKQYDRARGRLRLTHHTRELYLVLRDGAQPVGAVALICTPRNYPRSIPSRKHNHAQNTPRKARQREHSESRSTHAVPHTAVALTTATMALRPTREGGVGRRERGESAERARGSHLPLITRPPPLTRRSKPKASAERRAQSARTRPSGVETRTLTR